MDEYGVETLCVHSAKNDGVHYEPSVVFNGKEGTGTNTLENLEKCLASLEKANYGLCFPSGTSATSAVVQTLERGDHVIVFNSVYHGTRTYLNICEDLGKISVSFVDLRNASVLEKHLTEKTRLVWVETPCNPTMKIVDIAAISKIVKKHGKALLVFDNTFMSPCFQNPFALGADVVMHSVTKYLNGHSDCLMGTLITRDEGIFQKLKTNRDATGSIPSPLECFLVLRGLKTLDLRMKRHMKNGLAVARHLESHPKVGKVFHPGLPSHPQQDLMNRQCSGFSGLLSFCLKGGVEEAKEFVSGLKVFTMGVSLGSAESLIEIPSLMTARSLSSELRQTLEIPDNLIRISTGLESAEDLICDIDQALDKTDIRF